MSGPLDLRWCHFRPCGLKLPVRCVYGYYSHKCLYYDREQLQVLSSQMSTTLKPVIDKILEGKQNLKDFFQE